LTSPYLEAIRQRVVVFDGAMGTSLQALDLTANDFGGKEGCNDYLAIVKPEAVAAVHRGFLAAGCDVVETDTFGGSGPKLGEYGLEERVVELNRTAGQLARKVCDEFATPAHPRFVAGSIGPTGMLPS
jgi:5-methyltetrahydrofolate--homocysteine methyltransferase